MYRISTMYTYINLSKLVVYRLNERRVSIMKRSMRILSFILTLFVAAQFLPLQSTALGIIEEDDAAIRIIPDEEYYPGDYIGYRYPVRPGMPAWSQLSDHQEMVDACMIPEKILAEMTTEELAQTVLAYPLLSDIFAYSDSDIGVEVISAHFNGLQELSVRENSASVLVDLYIEQDANVVYANNGENTDATNGAMNLDHADGYYLSVLRLYAINAILGTDDYCNQMTEFDYEKMIEAQFMRKQRTDEEMTQSALFSSTTVVPVHMTGCGMATTRVVTISIIGGPVTLYETVWCERWLYSDGEERNIPFDDIPTELVENINEDNYNKYGMMPISPPTVKYNCHSYAWYMQSPSNPYWMNDPSTYLMTRGEKAEEDVLVSNKVVYYSTTDGTLQNPSHSGIVIGVTESGGERSFTIRSKWGMQGLYEHDLRNCPYYYESSAVADYGFYSS